MHIIFFRIDWKSNSLSKACELPLKANHVCCVPVPAVVSDLPVFSHQYQSLFLELIEPKAILLARAVEGRYINTWLQYNKIQYPVCARQPRAEQVNKRPLRLRNSAMEFFRSCLFHFRILRVIFKSIALSEEINSIFTTNIAPIFQNKLNFDVFIFSKSQTFLELSFKASTQYRGQVFRTYIIFCQWIWKWNPWILPLRLIKRQMSAL